MNSPNKRACNQVISDVHLEKISASHCIRWRHLPPYLGLSNVTRDDIDHKPVDERQKRYDFLLEWKQQKGSGATYQALGAALQEIKCLYDAECVFKLVKAVDLTSINHSKELQISASFNFKSASEAFRYKGEGEIENSKEAELKLTATLKQLNFRDDGEHIDISGTISVKLQAVKLGGVTLRNLWEPRGVAINKKGELVIAEWGACRISIFSHGGEKLREIKCSGENPGPSGVTVDGEENLLICNYGNHCIEKFSEDGHFLGAVGSRGQQRLQFDHPCDIKYNKVYVADTNNHRILVLNSDLTFFNQFGFWGSKVSEFDHPRHIATDTAGRLYVADSGNNRIQVFTPDGNFLTTFGKKGSGEGDLNWPRGVAIDDNNGLVYVCEYNNDRVSVFTPEGRFLMHMGRKGWRLGEFVCPHGIAVDNSGLVYVCDRDNFRVQVLNTRSQQYP